MKKPSEQTPDEARQVALPAAFADSTRRMMGETMFENFLDALSEEPPVSLRVNRRKTSSVPADDVTDGRVEWCDGGYYLAERPDFTFDPLLHAGHYYVQEASSMFVRRVLTRYCGNSPVQMLDLCAAPGGKSTAAVDALPHGSILMTNEPIRQRAQILMENMQKWGCPDVIVTNSYPRDYARSGLVFDVILCDVPCSGEGMFRKDSGAIGEWSPQNVDACSRLQREIVADAWRCLRPGGLMIYSTCTFNTAENEENVRWACDELGATVLPVDTDDEWGITPSLLPGFTAPVCRFIPGRTRGEGLFCAALRKGGEGEPCLSTISSVSQPQKNGKRSSRHGGDDTVRLQTLVSSLVTGHDKTAAGHDKTSAARQSALGAILPEDYRLTAANLDADPSRLSRSAEPTLIALPPRLVPLYETAVRSLRILSAGVTVGRIKGRDVIPDQSLALSTALRPDAFPTAGLTYAQAVAYLRKETVTLPSDTPRGFVLVTFRGAPLGFVKNIGSRANNLYPAEWKIKSTHVPDEPRVMGVEEEITPNDTVTE